MILGPLHYAAGALPTAAPSSPPPGPTPEDDLQASAPTYPACPKLINRSQKEERDTHARSLHAPRLPPSPATPPATSQPQPLPESSPPLLSPATPPPPLQIVPPTMPDAPADPAPPMPLLWPSALLYHNPATTHPSPSEPCHDPPLPSGALSPALSISSTTPPPSNKEMFQ
ncbi:hypothetical protein E4T56_gene585 [Termitomyces sp. T112]|nr:hypothetical protein E4T56_gene585 [Termitomyces sp. T112]